MPAQEIISTATVTKNGKKALASAFSYEPKTGKATFSGITFTGGGASEMPIAEYDETVPSTFSAVSGKVVNVVTIGNTLAISVKYKGNGKTIKVFSLHSIGTLGKEVVFAVCEAVNGITLNTDKTLRFALSLTQASETGEDATELSFVNGANATIEDVSNLSTSVDARITELSTRVSSAETLLSDMHDTMNVNNVITRNITVGDKTKLQGETTADVLTLKTLVPNITSHACGHIGKTDNPFESVCSSLFIGRNAVYENTGYLRDSTVSYPTGDSQMSVASTDAPDAMLSSISSTFSMGSKIHSDIVLLGHLTDKDSKDPMISLRAMKDNKGTVVTITNERMTVNGSMQISGTTEVSLLNAQVSNLGHIHIAGNFISIPYYNGSSISAIEDNTGSNPMNVQARVLPSGDKASMGSSEKRWKLYASQANVEGISFASLPSIDGIGNTRKVNFPVGCVAMLCVPTKEVTVCDVLDGKEETLRIWHDVGGSASGQLVQTKNKFIALSGAVAGRPFLAQCIG